MAFTITFVSVSDSGFRYLSLLMEELAGEKRFGDLFSKEITLYLHFVGEQRSHGEKLDRIQRDMEDSHMVLLDLMGAPAPVVERCEKAAEGFTGDLVLMGTGSDYLRKKTKLGRFSMASLGKMMDSEGEKKGRKKARSLDMEKMIDRMETLGKMVPLGPLKDMRNWIRIGKYWRFAGPENIRNLLFLICRSYGGIKSLPAPADPVEYSRYVLFDPGALRGFDTLEELKAGWGWDENRKTVGVLFYNFNYPNYSAGVLAEMIDRLKERYNVVSLGISSSRDKYKKIEALLDRGLTVDLLWSFLPFRFGAGPMGGDPEAGLGIFRRLNVPVMHPMLMGKRKLGDWQENVRGLSPMEVVIHLMLPELDGVIDAIPVAALGDAPEVGDLRTLRIINGRLSKLMSRSEAYLRLREKPNAQKRIAVILYNYPPGEGNVGGGSFLDTFASVSRITESLKQAGYTCNPVTPARLEAAFMSGGGCNTAKWHLPDAVHGSFLVGDYLSEDPLHQSMVARISSEWGDPPGKVMAGKDGFLIPGITEGNLFVGLQPPRGTHEDPSKQYHDKELPPHHQYMAFYRYLEREFKADAVIHVGTHGTLEFLPGKESGMSDTCFPDYLMGAMPHFYLYYSGNPAEATIAKRRTHACLVGYAGPPFRRSGSYGEYAELEGLLNEYAEAETLSPQRKAPLLERIVEKAAELKLAGLGEGVEKDAGLIGVSGEAAGNPYRGDGESEGWESLPDGEAIVDALSGELIRLKTMLMPTGLHEIGKPFTSDEQACFLGAMLGWDRGEVRPLQGIIRDEAERLKGCMESEPEAVQTVSPTPQIMEDRINRLTDRLIEDYYFGDKTLHARMGRELSVRGKKELDAALLFGETCLERILRTDEIHGLLNALDGNYVGARLGGDPIRDPEVFPAGFNLFQFDPQQVPSETAMARGREIAESTLDHYRKNNDGAYPESVSVVLWGLETSRTRGETVCQIMAYLGVRLKSTRASIEKKFEVIPLEELGRPRIDCVITICGFFRDMYPTLIDFLDAACDAVAGLEESEDQNFVRKHSRASYEELALKTDPATARELSRARIFGPGEGQYGTGITTVIESGLWKDEAELASAYLCSQKHIYTRNRRGEAREELFRGNLKTVELISQVRSSVDYTFSDLDHYYEFFGGLARSVEAVRGKKPEMLVTDSSAGTIHTDEAGKAVELGVRTRLLNPRYIEEMLKHDVHGAQQIGKRVENLVGLAATTGRVESWVFDGVKQTYFDDPGRLEKLRKNNPFAAAEMIMRMLEAWNRGYWDAVEGDVRELKELYMELEGEIEEMSDS